MTARLLPADRFVRRTQLGPSEYRKNFRQLDGEIIAAVTSADADAITPLMSKVYLRLVNAPGEYWEREGVLRFAGEERDSMWVTAWEQLVSLVGVASATARKALRWMHDEGIVGYFAGKNGVGIRVFLNRAASSIGRRPAPDQKNLRLVRASNDGARTSAGDTPFNDSFADLEISETDFNPRAPKSGAETDSDVKVPRPLLDRQAARVITAPMPSAAEVVERLLHELAPCVESAAARAAAREHERTREWLESKGLPKAARVAQREAYNVLRQHGLVGATTTHTRSGTTAEQTNPAPAPARPLSAEEVRELAETCAAMLEVHGQSIDVTLSELSAKAGGILLSEDAPRVRELAEALAYGGEKGVAP